MCPQVLYTAKETNKKQLYNRRGTIPARFFSIQYLQITLAKKQDLFQKEFEIFTYSRAELYPKHDVAFRFSLDQTVFP